MGTRKGKKAAPATPPPPKTEAESAAQDSSSSSASTAAAAATSVPVSKTITPKRSLLAESLSNATTPQPPPDVVKRASYGSLGKTLGVAAIASQMDDRSSRSGTPSPPKAGTSPRGIPASSDRNSGNFGSYISRGRAAASGGAGTGGGSFSRQGFGTPRSFTPSPMRTGIITGRGSPRPRPEFAEDRELTESEVARLVAEHLVLPDDGGGDDNNGAANKGASPHGSFVGTVSHNLLGGEVTRDIYQWTERRENPAHRRRNSEPDIRDAVHQHNYDGSDGSGGGDGVPRASELREPGVFRRHFVQTQAQRSGRALPSNVVTRNFLDFLALYGFYGGDVFPEDEDDDDDGDIGSIHTGGGRTNLGDIEDDAALSSPLLETQPLVPRSRTPSVAALHGGTSNRKAFFMVLKAFVGTGVLFLPKAFANGGMGFSLVCLVIIGSLTLHCMLLLVETSRKLGGSFGDIGEHLYGQWMRQLVLGSIALSQAGFCCAYYIFIAQNLRDFLMVVSDCRLVWPDWVFIAIQLAAYIPLSWVRKIKHFSITSLVADVFIMVGLAYILYLDVLTIATRGIATDFVWFNNQSFPLFVGTAMFAFEGICLILPIGESMKRPEQFGKVLCACTALIGAIFFSVGAAGYATFGAQVETVVFLNLPPGAPTQLVQLVYALAIVLSFPLTVYPTIRITEHALLGARDGKHDAGVKWLKNAFRAALVALLGVVAWFGADNLDKFVALVGCFACIPLSFIYPSLFHWHVAGSRLERAKDAALVGFGVVAMVYTTWITLNAWVDGEPDRPADRCVGVGH
ncbi:neutral amino acid transporter [Geranomyces variabilis]|uniref:Neutral amino acid transporter n=1 Tax=Geranomyces variabilis TaxID=109894 RepID=A0AAD5XLN0_9FUNG|nr:neutral amino acid transporter [Geranomyces variabilis]